MEPLTHARIGYDNILTRAAGIAAGANEGSPASAAANPLTYSHWRATMGAPRMFTVELDHPETVDYFGVAAHNLDSANIAVQLQAVINGAWMDATVLAGPTPGDVWTWDRDLRGERNSAPGATRATRVRGVARDGAPVLGPVGRYDPSEPDRLFASGELQCRGTVTRRAVSSRVVYGIGTNLLTNNVSTGTDALGDTTGFRGRNISSSTDHAVHGERSLRLDYDESDNDGVPFLTVPTPPGDYAIGFQIRFSGDLSGLTLVVSDGDTSTQALPLAMAVQDRWHELEIGITVGSGGSRVLVFIEGESSGATFYFDNLILTAGSVVPGFINRPWVPPGQTEYAVQIGETISTINMLHENVRTGSDLLGDLTGFADELGAGTGGATGESSTDRAHTGSRSIKIPISLPTGVDLVVFPVDRAVPHTFSCWIWVDGTSSAPLLELTLADDTAPTVAIDTQVVPRRFGEWLHLSVTGTPDVAATEMVVALHTSGSVGPGCTVYLDDFQAEIGEGWTPWYNGISPPGITVHGTHSITLEPAVENLLPDGTRNTTSAGGVTGDVVVDPSRSVSSATSFMVAKFLFPGVIEPGSFSTDPITPTAEVNHVGQLKVYLDEPAWVRLCLEDDYGGEFNYAAFDEYLAPGVWHTIITSGVPPGSATGLWLNFECSSHCWVTELAINETDRYVHWADGARDAGDLAYRLGLLRTASELTFSAWVQLPEEQPAGDQRLLHLYRSGGGLFGSVALQRNASTDEIRFSITNAEGLTVAVEPEVSCDGKWHMLTAVMARESITLYVDGAEAATAPVPSESWLPDLSGLSRFNVGHSPGFQSVGDTSQILMDDMIILGRALTAGEVAELHAHEGAYTLEAVGLPLPVTDDRPIMQLVEPVRSAQFRLVFTPQESPSEDLKVGVIFIGKALEMPRPIYGGHTPEPFARVTSVRPNVSERGQLLSRYITRSGMANSWTWQHLPAAWVRRHLAPFIEHARTEPFFVLWRPESFPDEAAYCWTEEDLRASNMGIRDLMAFTINAVGI